MSNLTAKQREAIQEAIFMMNGYNLPYITKQMKVLQDLLSGSKPAWKATEERQNAIERAILTLILYPATGQDEQVADDEARKVLRAMLEEARR